jgi:hypothetical protein
LKAYFIIFMLAATTPIVSKTGNRYLRAEDFPDIPADVRTQLVQAHCLIPQDVETKGAHNLVSGDFARKGQRDWAAYCSVNGQSRLIVIWGGPAKCSGDPLGLPAPVGDDSIYENADPGQWGRMPPHGAFWILSVVPQREVIARQRRGIALLPLLSSASHDALQRSSIAGVTGMYCTNGKWREVWYAD